MRICSSCQNRFNDPHWRCPACGWAPPERLGFPVFAPELTAEPVDFNPEFYGVSAQVDTVHFWSRFRHKIIGWALGKYFPQAASFLEVGCGAGSVLIGLSAARPALRLAGSDAQCEGLAFAAKRMPQASFFQANACYLPFEGEFDVVGNFDVLEHIEDDRLALRQFNKAIKPGGGLVLIVPQHRWLWSELDTRVGHLRRYRRRELLDKVRKAGFQVVRATSFISLLLPAMYLRRATKSYKDGNMATVEFKINPVMNWLMDKVMTLEGGLIRCGVSFPAGGSLLVVARKAPADGRA
jgi:2-polyprenyl-3-methyl-5-hydroxy-6-metoxy-1,4-benzoquinol methylase